DPRRRAAIMAAHRQGSYGIAAPLENASLSPTFAIYATVGSTGAAEGFIAAAFYFDQLFATTALSLNLSDRFQSTIEVEPLAGGTGLTVYQTATGQDILNPVLKRSSRYRILDQFFSLSLPPRPALVGATRRYLPELTLLSGLGV